MQQDWISQLTRWLAGAPPLADITLTTDNLGPEPFCGGLYPEGVTLLRRAETVCGGVTLRCRAVFALRLTLPTAAAPANADRLLALQDWVNRRRDAPRLGNADLFRETFTAAGGRLEQAGTEGTDRYVVRLTAEFTDKEEPDEN